jgi:hypothetical protein
MSTPRTTKAGTVERLVKPADPREPEKAQVNIHECEPLYQELRIEKTLTDQEGNQVRLKEGAEVEVHIDADKSATSPKKD